MIFQHTFEVKTKGREMINITPQVMALMGESNIQKGICHLFIHHTSASLIICENADPEVRHDLERFMSRLIPDGDPLLKHVEEGPDDMPSHIRTVLTQTSVCIPVIENELGLGVWQGIFLWEHRVNPHVRKVTVTLHD